MFTCLSGAQVMNEKRNAQHRHDRALSAALAKSGPLDFPLEKSFLFLFAHEKRLGHMFQK